MNAWKCGALAGISLAALGLTGCVSYSVGSDGTYPAPEIQEPVVTASAVANPANWPEAHSPAAITDAATEAAIDALLERMTLRQKVGHLVQADISTISPEDLRTYPLGSILAGGNSGPNGDDRSGPEAWDKLVREFRAVSMEPRAEGVAIPIIFGVDAVHGHNNIPNATLFPHNVGLGAARDPELLRRIGAVTAAEIAGTGIEWTFAPTLAVPQDGRWGRAYEGYSSDPAIVAAYSKAMIEGLQGQLVSGRVLAKDKVAATAKHFLADGGTAEGKDQGDAKISEAELVSIHAAGYPPAIDAGALTVMASFSSWNGVKHHGNKSLLTDVLKGRMGFDGFVVGDWNGHGQIAGCTATDCPQSINAGLDMYMAPDSWKELFESTLAHAESGEIPMDRIDDAVRRILRVKFKLGLMDGQPNDRGNFSVIGAPEHLAVAREAVSKSLVLLKNSGSLLPIKPGARVLVTGEGADNMAMQSGGWTIGWQGTDVTLEDFSNGQTIWMGIEQAVKEAGGSAQLSPDGSFAEKPDVAIVVFGETPYAEFQGDRAHLGFTGKGREQIEELNAAGIPVVSVFLSGRPMFTGAEISASDAFVAAWLPGSQGAGVADVLVAKADGTTKRDFTGRLSFAWPAGCEPGAPALFPLGHGGSYAAPPAVPSLATECSLSEAGEGDGLVLFDRGLKQGVYAFGGDTALVGLSGNSFNFSAQPFDVNAQEDARRLVWTGPSTLRLEFAFDDLPEQGAVEIQYQLAEAPMEAVTLSSGDTSVDLSSTLALAAGKGLRMTQIPLECLAEGLPNGLSVESKGPLTLELTGLRIVSETAKQDCSGPF